MKKCHKCNKGTLKSVLHFGDLCKVYCNNCDYRLIDHTGYGDPRSIQDIFDQLWERVEDEANRNTA